MKYLILIILYSITCYALAQNEHFTSENWTNIGGQTNTGIHLVTNLCYNQSGNYLNNEYYTWESPIYNFSDCDSILIEWNQTSVIRPGDAFLVCWFDASWYCYDMSNLIGTYSSYLPSTTTKFSLDLSTYGIGSRNGMFTHTDYFNVSCIQQPLPVTLIDFSCANNTIYFVTERNYNVDYFEIEYSHNGVYFESHYIFSNISDSDYEKLYTTKYSYEGYYRLIEVDVNGNRNELDMIHCDKICTTMNYKRYNVLGQEMQTLEGFYIEVIEKNGVLIYEKKFK